MLEVEVKNATSKGYAIARGGEMRLILHIPTASCGEEELVETWRTR